MSTPAWVAVDPTTTAASRTPRYSREHEVALFWKRVDTSSPGGCWPWLAGCISSGRGLMSWRGKRVLAYRISWELEHGEPPPSHLHVCHHCDNGLCVRPSHLFLGDDLANVRDMRAKGRHVDPPIHVGERHPQAKISDDLVRTTRERYAAGGVTAVDLARELGVSPTSVKDWLRGKTRVSAGGPIVESVMRLVRASP